MHANLSQTLLASAVLFCLSGCSSSPGSPGSSTQPPTVPVSPPTQTQPGQPVITPRKGSFFSYFGDVDPQMEETKDHVNLAMIDSWWSFDLWEQLIERQCTKMQLYKDRGIEQIILFVDYCLFEPFTNNQRTLLPAPESERRLLKLFQAIHGYNLESSIFALYPIDEPNLYAVGDDTMDICVQRIKAAWAVFSTSVPKFACFYTGFDYNFVGAQVMDYVGIDYYDKGAEILAGDLMVLKSAIRPDQKLMLIPGGSDPWKTGPDAFLQKLLEDEQVAGIVAFVWFDRTDEGGQQRAGIRNNGLAADYTRVGLLVKQNG